MDVKVTVRRRIRYQGKEYESVNELPEPIRHAVLGQDLHRRLIPVDRRSIRTR